jgi:hypothetical protein
VTDAGPQATPAAGRSRAGHLGAATLWFVLVVVAGAFALSVDVVRAGYGVKSDEATYMAAALSAAHDRNLSYERRDLERFWGIYRQGPDGIFLKRGKTLRLRRAPDFPYLQIVKRQDPRADRLYYGKALIYPLLAAPFVWLFGLNGVLVFHVLLLALVGACAYVFMTARSSPLASVVFTTAFLGAAAVPVYGVFLMPEIFNFALVFLAYFFWLYREVSPRGRLSGLGPQVIAAVLLGCATYSKPIPNGFLIAPLVALAAWRRQWRFAAMLAAIFVAATAAWFLFNAAVTGEFNYQGGDRKTFIAAFPFDAPGASWERRGVSMVTSGSAAGEVLTSRELPARFARNLQYFLVGRHFGLVPYSFPGAVAILLWVFSPARRDPWRLLTFLTFAGAAVALLLILPYTWSGGGGPPGNRYLLSAYAMLFFLVPPLQGAWPGVLAWIGGALFTAKMLVSPFVAAKFTYLTTERGPARRLPVELTMANDLPIMLDSSRARIPYRNDPTMLLYFLDQNASPPEPEGMWVSGSGRSDILVRTVDPIDHLAVTAHSPIRTLLTVSIGGPEVTVEVTPGREATFDVPAAGVRGLQSYAYLLRVRSSEGFTPRVQYPGSVDSRNLGAQMHFRAVVRHDATKF